MTFHTFLIKYGEIGIKGKNRYMFEDALVRQIRYALREADGSWTQVPLAENAGWDARPYLCGL